LHYAARNGHAEIVELLLGVGSIDVNVRDNREKTALYFTRNQDIRAALERRGAK
jgi:ankyrin repeat protein